MVVKLNYDSLKNICDCMDSSGQALFLTGALLLLHWKSFAVTNQYMTTVQLFHLKQFAIYSFS